MFLNVRVQIFMFTLGYMVLITVFYVYTRCPINTPSLFTDSCLSKHFLSIYYMPGIQKCPMVYLKDLGVVRGN